MSRDVAENIVELIGHTPLLHLARFCQPPLADVYAKLDICRAPALIIVEPIVALSIVALEPISTLSSIITFPICGTFLMIHQPAGQIQTIATDNSSDMYS